MPAERSSWIATTPLWNSVSLSLIRERPTKAWNSSTTPIASGRRWLVWLRRWLVPRIGLAWYFCARTAIHLFLLSLGNLRRCPWKLHAQLCQGVRRSYLGLVLHQILDNQGNPAIGWVYRL